MKDRLLLISVVVVLVATGVIVWRFVLHQPEGMTLTGPTPVLDRSALLHLSDSPRPSVPTPAPLGDNPSAKDIAAHPLVRFIRTALDTYLSGSTDGIDPGAVGRSSLDGLTCGLSLFPASGLSGKFIVLDSGDDADGGLGTDIAFPSHPDTMYWVWTRQSDGGQPVVKAFCKSGPAAGQQTALRQLIHDISTDPEVIEF